MERTEYVVTCEDQQTKIVRIGFYSTKEKTADTYANGVELPWKPMLRRRLGGKMSKGEGRVLQFDKVIQ